MSKVCDITGAKVTRGSIIHRRGMAKKKGGVGLKQVGVHKRTQKPNLQKKTIWLGGKAQRVYLSTKALRSLEPSLLSPPRR